MKLAVAIGAVIGLLKGNLTGAVVGGLGGGLAAYLAGQLYGSEAGEQVAQFFSQSVATSTRSPYASATGAMRNEAAGDGGGGDTFASQPVSAPGAIGATPAPTGPSPYASQTLELNTSARRVNRRPSGPFQKRSLLSRLNPLRQAGVAEFRVVQDEEGGTYVVGTKNHLVRRGARAEEAAQLAQALEGLMDVRERIEGTPEHQLRADGKGEFRIVLLPGVKVDHHCAIGSSVEVRDTEVVVRFADDIPEPVSLRFRMPERVEGELAEPVECSINPPTVPYGFGHPTCELPDAEQLAQMGQRLSDAGQGNLLWGSGGSGGALFSADAWNTYLKTDEFSIAMNRNGVLSTTAHHRAGADAGRWGETRGFSANVIRTERELDPAICEAALIVLRATTGSANEAAQTLIAALETARAQGHWAAGDDTQVLAIPPPQQLVRPAREELESIGSSLVDGMRGWVSTDGPFAIETTDSGDVECTIAGRQLFWAAGSGFSTSTQRNCDEGLVRVTSISTTRGSSLDLRTCAEALALFDAAPEDCQEGLVAFGNALRTQLGVPPRAPNPPPSSGEPPTTGRREAAGSPT